VVREAALAGLGFAANRLNRNCRRGGRRLQVFMIASI